MQVTCSIEFYNTLYNFNYKATEFCNKNTFPSVSVPPSSTTSDIVCTPDTIENQSTNTKKYNNDTFCSDIACKNSQNLLIHLLHALDHTKEEIERICNIAIHSKNAE